MEQLTKIETKMEQRLADPSNVKFLDWYNATWVSDKMDKVRWRRSMVSSFVFIFLSNFQQHNSALDFGSDETGNGHVSTARSQRDLLRCSRYINTERVTAKGEYTHCSTI